jgi:hypothetical protein
MRFLDQATRRMFDRGIRNDLNPKKKDWTTQRGTSPERDVGLPVMTNSTLLRE